MASLYPLCLEVWLQSLLGVALKVGYVETVSGDTVHSGKEVPCHGDRANLEVVAKRPVAQHLEEGVVVCVLSNIVEVWLSARAVFANTYHCACRLRECTFAS